MRSWMLIVAVAVAAACAQDDMRLEVESTETLSEAVTSSLDVSELPQLAYRGEMPATVAHAGCDGTVDVIAETTVCDERTYPSLVSVEWVCEGAQGGLVIGSATVATTITPDACPPSALTFEQSIELDRSRSIGARTVDLFGDVEVRFEADTEARTADKDVDVALDREVRHLADVRGYQQIRGSKNVRIEDERRIVNGEVDIEFLLRRATMRIGRDDLTWERGCCYPIAGTVSFERTVERESRKRSITFGPTCGEATVELRPCPRIE